MIVIHVQHFFCTFHYQCKHDEDNDAWKGRFKNITLVCWRDFCSAFLQLSKCIKCPKSSRMHSDMCCLAIRTALATVLPYDHGNRVRDHS